MLTDTLRTTEPLIERVRRVQDALKSAGIEPVDMRRAGTLENDIQLPEMGGDESFELPAVELLDHTFQQHEINRHNYSGFRWFVDGSQKTMPIWRIGVVPIVVSVTVAGVLERDSSGDCHLMPGTLAENVTWIVPEQTGNPELGEIISLLRGLGEDVRDPLHEKSDYQSLAGIYDQVLYYANKMSGKRREDAEDASIEAWRTATYGDDSDKWLLIDGRLTAPITNAVGLIKDPGRQHFGGDEAVTVFNLPPGHRTTAYQLTERGRKRTHWYQRMWPGTGLDARHSLIRIEARGDMGDNEEIDDIASWLMAERVPRPTADSRWPTLLYPVHLLERILKRRIAQITAGWPV